MSKLWTDGCGLTFDHCYGSYTVSRSEQTLQFDVEASLPGDRYRGTDIEGQKTRSDRGVSLARWFPHRRTSLQNIKSMKKNFASHLLVDDIK